MLLITPQGKHNLLMKSSQLLLHRLSHDTTAFRNDAAVAMLLLWAVDHRYMAQHPGGQMHSAPPRTNVAVEMLSALESSIRKEPELD